MNETAPLFSEFVETYLATHQNLKRESTLKCERVHLDHCSGFFDGVRLNRITKSGILAFRTKKLAEGWTGRSANLSLSILRNLLRHAVDCGLILQSPADGIRPVKWVPKKRSLVTQAEIAALCEAALEHSKNGRQLADYLKLMSCCGSRRNETLRLKWSDVNWERKQLTIGSDGQTKMGMRGMSFAQIAEELGISRAVLYRLRDAHPEFRAALELARDRSIAHWERIMMASCADRNFNAHLFQFMMKNLFPTDYRDRHDVAVSGPEGGPIPLGLTRSLSHEELLRLAAPILEAEILDAAPAQLTEKKTP